MDPTIVYVLFGTFFLLLLLGAPITASLGVSALAAFLYIGQNPATFVQIAFTSVGSFPLMALPAFILAGLVPLLPMFVSIHTPAERLFGACAGLTGIAFFVIGYIRGRVVEFNPWISGVETVLIGGAAASLAYVVGAWLRQFAVG